MAKILIVDDEPTDRALLDTILREAGHQILMVANGSSAAEVLKDRPFDLVITDVAMREGTGLDLIRKIREDSQKLPVIAVSGFAPEYLARAGDLGADFTLTKPIDRAALLALVEKVLGPE
jgi:CheY-like chemotaxis protein